MRSVTAGHAQAHGMTSSEHRSGNSRVEVADVDHTERTSLTASEHRRKEQILAQPGPSKLAGSHNGAVLKSGEVFLVVDDGGDIPWKLPHAFGLYFRDTRFVNGLTVRIQGQSLVPLANTHFGGQDAAIDLVNPPLRDEHGTNVPQHTVSVRRERRLHGGVLHERIQLTNYFDNPVRLQLEIRIRCGFEDIFVVKQFVNHPSERQIRPKVMSACQAAWRYRGLDDVSRAAHLIFDPPATSMGRSRALFTIDLEPDQSTAVGLAITPAEGGTERNPGQPRRLESLDPRIERSDSVWLQNATDVRSSSDLFDRVFQRAQRDLRTLRSRLGRQHYFAAGIPWFVTLFGRDSAIVAIQTLPYGWAIARDTIELLARHQAQRFDEYRDAEPGKILHEFRRGELARSGQIPQSPSYYGSVDATALFVILFVEYVLWSGDLEIASRLRRELDAALQWLDSRMATDDYLTYDGEYSSGLVNQGWKDSGNAIVNDDGSLAKPPIALAEVQGYVFRAWSEAALLHRALGEHSEAERRRTQADALADRFDRDFWMEAQGCYVLARQSENRAAAVVASNSGQVLWTGIARAGRASRVVDRLLREDMFTGWGIRTLSSRESRYNPVSYHLGSVWPHDNAFILAGFRRYGHNAGALRIFDALLDASIEFRGRLPELFCGFARREHESPVPYPAASTPQAWAAGSLPHGLWSLLGLRPNAVEHRLRIVRPVLPNRLDWLMLKSLRIGSAQVDLRFTRHDDRIAVDATIRAGHLDVHVSEEAAPPDSWD
jgi:glycogen debranching enzyme